MTLKLVERLAKLAASKDIATYTALGNFDGSAHVVGDTSYLPMDDESVARRMMAAYSESGMDPSLALSPDSDPLEDFGGTSAVFGAKD